MSEETQFLQYLNNASSAPHTSLAFAKVSNLPHDTVVGLIKKLEVRNMIKTDIQSVRDVSCTEEGDSYVKLGKSAESLVLEAVAAAGEAGLAKKNLVSSLQEKFSIDANLAKTIDKAGFGEAKKRGWIDIQKGALVAKVASDTTEDDTYAQLNQIAQGNSEQLDEDTLGRLKKRKLIDVKNVKYFTVQKGEDFALEVKDTGATDLTHEALRSGKWKEQSFKPYNFAAKGKPTDGGYMHPLLKVRSEFRKIFLELGFQEMTTNRFVESSFWNFDALFQPQQHPARDAHDTFFTSEPKNCLSIPEDYMKRVKKVHEEGGYGSVGYRYNWSLDVSKTNLLRTHTTAVSSRVLYDVAQEYQKTGKFTPRKFFSIDRVFRNETTDETHLCEFHQVEGMVIDRGLSLGDMIGLFSQFFAKIGITDLRFKPAYNPYTEPSMEIFGFHPQLGKWTEIGNSGMFRPEMLEPMGLPSDVVVLAWGLSLERPTMILYGINHIQHLMGHTVEVSMTRDYPICQLDKKH